MEYFNFKVKFLKSGGVKFVEGAEHFDEQSADSKFYRNVGNDMDDDTLSGSVCVCVGSNGWVQNVKGWGEIIPSNKTE